MERAELARLLGGVPPDASRPPVPNVIAAPRPRVFMTEFAHAVAGRAPVVLSDPDWVERDPAVLELLADLAAVTPERGWLLIRTGGSSGAVKFARHDEQTLLAAVRGFCRHFGLEKVNAISVLPLHHVSGLMAWLRSALTGGAFRPQLWHELKQGHLPELDAHEPWVISLVPTQLQRLLELPAAVEWLRGFRVIFVGGGPVWPALAEAAARARLPVSLSYGMTETAAMVAALQPEEFLAGARSSGRALPHVTLSVGGDGLVRVAGESVFRGYWPEWRDAREFATSDLGRIDEQGHLHILGRSDEVIITGGKKVNPADVEAALRASGEFDDVAVIGVPDPEWGEAVVACYPANATRPPDVARAAERLAPHERPKRFVALVDWPRNAQGKINRAALREAVEGGRRS